VIAARLHQAGILALRPSALRAMCRLPDNDVDVAVEAVAWLRDHPDLMGFTIRQIPVPGMHTKWLLKHRKLVELLADRKVLEEARPRLSVVHLTYVDPDYLASGGRRHDAWTSGDQHDLAYRPENVLIVENRDCRLWFPDMARTVVVEGAGLAASTLLSDVEWIVRAQRVVYWGDIDSDGFRILSNLRSEMASRGVYVESLLMDGAAHSRYGHLGVSFDRHGQPLKASGFRLPRLRPVESDCYAAIASAGAHDFRRIEQERIDLGDAVIELVKLLASPARAVAIGGDEPREALPFGVAVASSGA